MTNADEAQQCESVVVGDDGGMQPCERDGVPRRDPRTGMTLTCCPPCWRDLQQEANPTATRGVVGRLLAAVSGRTV